MQKHLCAASALLMEAKALQGTFPSEGGAGKSSTELSTKTFDMKR